MCSTDASDSLQAQTDAEQPEMQLQMWPLPADTGKRILGHMSSEESNEPRSNRLDMKGIAPIFFITLLFSFILRLHG